MERSFRSAYPKLPNRFPIFGTVLRFLFRKNASLYSMFDEWMNLMKAKLTFRTYFPGVGNFVVTKDLELIEELNEKTCFHLVTSNIEETGCIVFMSNEEKWSILRRKLAVHCNPNRSMMDWVIKQEQVYDHWIPQWKMTTARTDFYPYENIHLMVLESMLSVYPIRFTEKELADIRIASVEFDHLLDKRTKNIFTFNKKKLLDWYGNIQSYLFARTHDRNRFLLEMETIHIMDLLIAVKNMTFTLTYFMIFMAKNPHWQAILKQELEGKEVHTYEDYLQCTQTRIFMMECMRLKAATPMMASTSTESFTFNGIHHAPNTVFIKLLENVMKESTLNSQFPKESFNPNRFLDIDGNIKPEGERLIGLSFGSGPRECPGKFIAKLMGCMFLKKMLLHFDIHLPKQFVEPTSNYIGIVNTITNRPKLLLNRVWS